MKESIRVYGTILRAPRMTRSAAVLLACALSVPVFAVLSLIEWFWL